jgi:hypothetical protein
MNIHDLLPYTLPIIITIAYVRYLTYVPQSNSGFIHFIVFIIVIWLIYSYNVARSIDEADPDNATIVPDTFLSDLEAQIGNHQWHSDHTDLYADSMGNKPFKFLFLQKHVEVIKILKDIEFAQRYDKASYMQSAVLIERFLRRYYKIINIDDEDTLIIEHMLTMLKDIRKELMNSLHTLLISVPVYFKRPVLKNKQPTSRYLRDSIRKIQAFTYDKLLLASKKANNDGRNTYNRRHSPPYSLNEFKNVHDVY